MRRTERAAAALAGRAPPVAIDTRYGEHAPGASHGTCPARGTVTGDGAMITQKDLPAAYGRFAVNDPT